jgi:hypothetical protein
MTLSKNDTLKQSFKIYPAPDLCPAQEREFKPVGSIGEVQYYVTPKNLHRKERKESE